MTPPLCFYLGKIKTVVKQQSCTFCFHVPSPQQQRVTQYTIAETVSCEEQNDTLRCSHRLQYFTQRILYSFSKCKVKVFLAIASSAIRNIFSYLRNDEKRYDIIKITVFVKKSDRIEINGVKL